MTRIVIQPMDRAATKAADTATYAAYPITPSPGDADYAAFQKFWMDTYIANGGKYKVRTPEDEQAAVKKAREASKGNKATAGASQECSSQGHGAGQAAGGRQAAGAGSGKGAGKTFKPKEKPCSCVLTSGSVTCSHGRSSKSGLLQIVPKSIAGGYAAATDNSQAGFRKGGDDITIKPVASGGDCSSKLIIRTNGFAGSKPTETKGPKTIKRPTKGANASAMSALGLWRASPSIATAEVTTCGGNPALVRIERFPMGETSFSLNISKIIKGVTGGFNNLPFDNALFTKKGTPRQRRRAGEAKSEDFTLAGLKKRARKGIDSKGAGDAEIVFKIASAWKEEEGTHLAFCEMAGIVEADPLLSFGTEILLYGIPIPKIVRKYCNVAAGFFLGIEGKISIMAKLVGKKYPSPKGSWEWDSIGGEVEGSLKFALKGELIVLSPKAVQAVVSGSTGVAVKGEPKNSFNSKIMMDVELTIGGLTTKAMFKAAWGLIEYEKNWKLFEPWKPKKTIELVDFNK